MRLGNPLMLPQMTSAPTPASGTHSLYFLNDGALYQKDSNGFQFAVAGMTGVVTTLTPTWNVLLDTTGETHQVVSGDVVHGIFPQVNDRVMLHNIGGTYYITSIVSQANAGGWTPTPYAGYYVGYGSGQRDPAYRRVDGYVEMRGLVKLANAGGTTITVLPSGYRPSQIELFGTTFSANGSTFSGAATVQVAVDGTVTVASGGVVVGGWVSLAGIRFQADGS